MEKQKFKNGQICWIFNGDDYQKEKVVKFWDITGEYEITDGNFYEESELSKSKKECALRN